MTTDYKYKSYFHTFFVTHSENGWAILYNGGPICNQKMTYAEVLAAATQMNCTLHDDYYDGTTNTWKPRTTI